MSECHTGVDAGCACLYNVGWGWRVATLRAGTLASCRARSYGPHSGVSGIEDRLETRTVGTLSPQREFSLLIDNLRKNPDAGVWHPVMWKMGLPTGLVSSQYPIFSSAQRV